MSNTYKKIKYLEDGSAILSFNDTLDQSIFDKMIEIIRNWKTSSNIENMTQTEKELCK